MSDEEVVECKRASSHCTALEKERLKMGLVVATVMGDGDGGWEGERGTILKGKQIENFIYILDSKS